MLSHLHIKNFAIIEEEDVYLSDGFTVLTGETGAGKSIILDAMTLILGSRAHNDMIRRGKQKALIEANFQLDGDHLALMNTRLEQLGIKSLPKGKLQIMREVSLNGKNRCRVNRQVLKISHLKALTEGLIEVVRQHESYTLLDADQHLSLLDSFGALEDECVHVKQAVDKWQSLEREYKRLQHTQSQRKERLHYLDQHIQQVERLSPESHEDERLDRELKLLHASERLRTWVHESMYTVYEQNPSLLDQLYHLTRGVEQFVTIDEQIDGFHQTLTRASMELEELSHDLRRFLNELPVNQDQLSDLEHRRNQLEQLKIEHNSSLAEIITKIEVLKQERTCLKHDQVRLKHMQKEIQKSYQIAHRLAANLSGKRRTLIQGIETEVENELQTLGMAQCRFKADFQSHKLMSTGLDKIEFLISPNPGEGFKPLVRIASGGELSRLTLALKVVLMHQDKTPTYIFDEVDSGIGGGIAEGVGIKLRKIANDRQVLCITHLPQVASCADQHMKIQKILLADRTMSSINGLSDHQRLEEVARMLGGQDMTEATFAHALEMIQKGQRSASSLFLLSKDHDAMKLVSFSSMEDIPPEMVHTKDFQAISISKEVSSIDRELNNEQIAQIINAKSKTTKTQTAKTKTAKTKTAKTKTAKTKTAKTKTAKTKTAKTKTAKTKTAKTKTTKSKIPKISQQKKTKKTQAKANKIINNSSTIL
jgi:DNA repair protein RecN (Recombination protein N)